MRPPRAAALIHGPPSPVAEAEEGGGGDATARRPLPAPSLSPEFVRRVLNSSAMTSSGLDADGLDPHGFLRRVLETPTHMPLSLSPTLRRGRNAEQLPSRRTLRGVGHGEGGLKDDLKEEQERWPTEAAHAWPTASTSPGHAGSPDPDRLASPRAPPRATVDDSPGCRRRTSAAVAAASPLRRSGLVVGTDGPLPGSGEINSPAVDEPDELRGLRIAQTHRSQLARGTRPPPLAMNWLANSDD